VCAYRLSIRFAGGILAQRLSAQKLFRAKVKKMAAKVAFSSISSTMFCVRYLVLVALFTSFSPLFAGVNPDGSYSETLPIEIPAGRQGMQPRLALSYNSNSGNGIAGVGWSMQGLPAITRMNYGNGINYGKAGFPADTYAGPEGRLIDMGAGIYHAETETWSKYEPSGSCGNGPCSWLVTDRNGLKYYYGLTSNSRIVAKDTNNNDINNGAVRVWALERVTDLNGNYYEVEYYQHQGQYYPRRIEYTHGPGASKHYTITFSYDETGRPDKEISYAQSSYVRTAWRLSEVLVEAQQPIWWIFSWTVQVRRYSLRFSNSAALTVSRLAEFEEFDVANVWIRIRNIAWADGPQAFGGTTPYFMPFSDANGWHAEQYYSTIKYVDLDLDGKPELCARDSGGLYCYKNNGSSWVSSTFSMPFSDANGWNQPQYYSTISYPDINGDGRPDLCARDSGYLSCYQNNGTSWVSTQFNIGWSDANGWNQPQYYSTISYPDLDGDGRADLCARDSGYLYCYRNNGTSWVGTSFQQPWSDANGWNQPQYYGTINYPDLNGDGRADLCARDTGGVHCYLNIANSWQSSMFTMPYSDAMGWAAQKYFATISYPDINNDGLADICARDSGYYQCQLNNGRNWAFAGHIVPMSDANGWGERRFYSTIRFADINADGRTDFCVRDSGGFYCLSNISSAWQGTAFSIALTDWNGWTEDKYFSTIHLIDVDGNGIADLCYRDSGGINCIPTQGQPASLVTEISGPASPTVGIAYTPAPQLPKTICPTPCTGPQGETLSTAHGIANSAPRYLVTQVTTTSDRDLDGNGTVDSFVTRYEYYNGRVSTGTITERASLGFEKIKTTDVNSGNHSITTYRQDKPFQGNPAVSRSYLANHTLVSESISAGLQQYLCDETGCTIDVTNNPNPTQPKQIRQSGETASLSYEGGILIGGKFEQILSQDTYGNPLKTKSRISANGAERIVYRFITYLNETSATRAIGLPISEKTCYTESECATGDNDFISESRIYYDDGIFGTVGSRHLATRKESFMPTASGTGVWVNEVFTYNAAGGLLTTLDARGILTTITYDSDYNQFPVNITKSHGGKSSAVTAVFDPKFGRKISETVVDENRTMTTLLDATGFAYEISTLNNGTLASKTTTTHSMPGETPIWSQSCTHFGSSFSQTKCNKKFTDALGRTYREEYPDLVNGLETQMAILYKYDSRSRVVQNSQPFVAVSGTASQWNSKTYDDYGRVIATLSFDNKSTATAFQFSGLSAGLVSCTISTAIDGKQQRSCTNNFGQLASTIQSYGTPNAIETVYSYDARGRLIAVHSPQGLTNIGYLGISGRQAFIEDPVAGRTDYHYHLQPGQADFSKLASETRAGHTVTMEYFASFGRLSKMTQSDAVTTYIYDENDVAFGQNKLTTLTHVVDGYTLTERYSYNARSEAVAMTRRIAHATEALCADANAMPCLQTFGLSNDELGRTQSITYPDGKVTQLSYIGSTGNVTTVMHDGTTYATYSDYVYDVAPHPTKMTYANGVIHDYTYQPTTGLMSSVRAGKANLEPHLQFNYAYDSAFNIQSISDVVIPDLSVTYQYDALNRLRQTAYGSGEVRDFRFDQDAAGNSKGNLVRQANRRMVYAPGKTYPVSDELYNETTGLWEAHQTMSWSPAGSLLTKGNFTYFYDSNQMMKKAVEANSAPGSGQAAETQFVYDHTGQRFLKKHIRGGVAIKTWYLGDAIELREKYIGVSDSNSVGTLEKWQATKYIYGQDSKRIASVTGEAQSGTVSATPGTLFALADGYSSSTASGLAKKAYYTFYGAYALVSHGLKPAANRLTLLIFVCGFLILFLLIANFDSYGFKPVAIGWRLTASGMAVVFLTVSCGQNTLPNGISQGQIDTMISDLYTGLPVGTVYYSHNHLGSGALVTDENGDEIFRIGYSEYGEIEIKNSGKWNHATQTLEKNFNDAELLVVAVKFTGQEFDPETGFYYYNARYYSPQLGVFTTSDIEFDEGSGFGFNRHMYVGGNPIMATDPTGHSLWDIVKTVAAVIANPAAAINAGVAAVAGANAYNQATTGNWLNASQGWQAFGAGAQAGAIMAAGAMAGGSAGLGAGALFGGGFWGTVGAGAVGGFAGGFTGGSMTGWNNGRSFGDGLRDGLTAGAWGALIGGATAGIGYGLFGGGESGGVRDPKFDLGSGGEHLCSNGDCGIGYKTISSSASISPPPAGWTPSASPTVAVSTPPPVMPAISTAGNAGAIFGGIAGVGATGFVAVNSSNGSAKEIPSNYRNRRVDCSNYNEKSVEPCAGWEWFKISPKYIEHERHEFLKEKMRRGDFDGPALQDSDDAITVPKRKGPMHRQMRKRTPQPTIFKNGKLNSERLFRLTMR